MESSSTSDDGPAATAAQLADQAAFIRRHIRRQLGLRVGPYELRAPLGRGAFGVVCLAFDARLGREVAIKFLFDRGRHRRGRHRRGRHRDRIRREARAIAGLHHPNIVKVYDVGEHHDPTPMLLAFLGLDGRRRASLAYVVMERLAGPRLDVYLREHETPTPRLLDLFGQAARALQAAHEAGIIHRDFKPGNAIVVGATVKVLDFGCCVDAGTTTPHPAGTPAYMAPEQLRGVTVDARADQFAWAVAFAEAFTHRRIRCPRQLRRASGLPRQLKQVLARALNEDPQRRWPDMASADAAVPSRPRRAPSVVAVALTLGVGALMVAPSKPHARDHSATRALDARDVQAQRRIEALHDRGDFAAARTLAEDRLADARRRGDTIEQTEALFVRGAARTSLGEADGMDDLRNAYWLARQEGLDRVALLAATTIIRRSVLYRHADALPWIPAAEALAVSVGRGTRLQAMVHNDIGTLLEALGEREHARTRYEQAWATLQGVDAPGKLPGLVLANLAGAALMEDRFDDAAAMLQRAVVALADALGPDHPALAQPLRHLAWAERELGFHRDARVHLRRAHALAEPGRAGAISRADALRQIAWTLEKDGNVAAASEAFEGALAELGAADRAVPRAILQTSYGQFLVRADLLDPAIAALREAARALEDTLGSPSPQLAYAKSALAVALAATGQYTAATLALTDARAQLERTVGVSHPQVGALELLECAYASLDAATRQAAVCPARVLDAVIPSDLHSDQLVEGLRAHSRTRSGEAARKFAARADALTRT